MGVASHRDGGIVYVVQGLKDSPVKIGFCRDRMPLRLAQIQNGNPHPLRVVTTAPGSIIDERRVHAALGAERMVGEWFAWLPRTVRFVTHMACHRNIAAAVAAIEGRPEVPSDWDLLVIAESRVAEVFGLKGPYRAVIGRICRESQVLPHIERPTRTGTRAARFYGMGDVKRWLLENDIPHVVASDAGRFTRPRDLVVTPSPVAVPNSSDVQAIVD